MQTQSSSTRSATKQKRKRFPWVIGVLVSIVLIAILVLVAVTLLVLSNQGVTQGISTLTILSIVVGFVVSLLSLLVSFLQWHHPKAPPAFEEIPAASVFQTPPMSTSDHPQSDGFPNDPRREGTEKTTLPSVDQRSQRFDWGEAPHMDQLYGRNQELATLKQWMTDDSCRLVAILGMGGIGKTSLTATLVDQMHEHYDYVFWRSLHNAPPFKRLLQECIQFVSHQQQTDLPEEVEGQISLLIEYFRTYHCLLVLDNVESILQEGSQTGYYREGYGGYGRLITRIGESKHQSCLLLTSREKPPEVAFLEGEAAATRSLHLSGLKPADGRDVLRDKGLQGGEHDWGVLISHYEGNPLALKLVAPVIREVFGGMITTFLTDGELFFRDVRDVLEQQLKRLSALEEEIVYWLVIEREATTLSDLRENIVHSMPKGELQEALRSLRRRQLIETSATGFTLHPVILEYLIDRLLNRLCEEIKTGTLLLFEQHALLLAQAKEYIRESQCRLILLPLLHRLLVIFGKEALEERFQFLLATLREQHDQYPGYAAGNILNLLIQMGSMLCGYDFSRLVVRQAYLQGVTLTEVNFAHADLMTSVFTNTFGSILCVALSQQGDLLAAGTATSEVRLWHAASGLPQQTFCGHDGWVRSIAFSPDGRTLASSSDDQTVRLWEVSSGKLLNTLSGHTSVVYSVAFSPDGRTLASGSDDQTVRLWEVSSSTCLTILQGHTSVVYSVAFSPDGKTLASGSEDRTICLWEVSSGKLLNTLLSHTSVVYSVAFSPDGRTLASGSYDQAVRLWEVSSGKLLNTLLSHTSVVYSVAFSPDGRTLASGSEDRTICLWEVSSGKLLNALLGHTNRVESVAFSPDGRTLASGYEDREVRLWEVNSGKLLNTLSGHNQWVRSVAFSPDGRTFASGSGDRTVRLWEVSSGKLLNTLSGHNQWVYSVAFSPDGRTLASGSEDRTICLWEVSSGKLLNTLSGHSHWVRSVAFSPAGKILASGSYDQAVRLWEVSSGQCLNILPGNQWVYSVAFSPDGKTLASGSEDRTICLWEVSSGKLLNILLGHTNAAKSVAFSPDGRTLASGSEDRTIRLWEVSSGKLLNILLGHDQWIHSVAFSPDGRTLASGSYDGAIKLWDRQSGMCLRTLRSDRPYERMNITQVKGLTEAQKATLRSLGAIENE